MKLTTSFVIVTLYAHVAPRVGAWIEMAQAWLDAKIGEVAPRVGAWIEINKIHRLRR